MLKYKGLAKPVNSQPEGEWIKISVQNLRKEWEKESNILVAAVINTWATEDWLRTYDPRFDNLWDFHVWISLDNYENDIEDIKKLVRRLKRKGDTVYVSILKSSEGLKEFAEWIMGQVWSPYSDVNCIIVLDPEKWKEWLRSHQIEKRQSAK